MGTNVSPWCWADHTHPDHLRPAEAEAGGGASLHFPIAAARPLPAQVGLSEYSPNHPSHFSGLLMSIV